MDLRSEFALAISAGLQRRAVTTCSRWAETYRVMGEPFSGPWRFTYHPWLKGMMDSNAELNVGQKAAQMGYSECVLNRAFYTLDVLKQDVLYVLPNTSPDASDFSAGRFTPALELSPHLHQIFSDANNVGHKRAGPANLYIRGSRSRSALKSVPAGFVVGDELDEFTIEHVPMMFERMSGQLKKAAWLVSTPTLENYGINDYFQKSSQNHFFFRCPSCSRMIELSWPESIVIPTADIDDPKLKDTHLICTECKAVLPQATKTEWLSNNEWVPKYPDRDSQGWFITQLYSCTTSPVDVARKYLRSSYDKAAEVEFNNQVLGRPHAVEGAKLNDNEISACIEGYESGSVGPSQAIVTMGVDVGTWLHYHIDEYVIPPYANGIDINIYAQCRTLKFGKVKTFEELDEFMMNWGIRYSVIDAQPERRKAIEFANRFYGRVKVCFYGNGVSGRTLMVNDSENSVTVDRTTWLDIALGRYRRGKPWLIIPSDIDTEYRANLKALVRDYRNDQWGNPIGRYIKASRDQDHYAHARTYAEIALPLAANIGTSTDLIRSVL
jgi:hypothetical protein